MARPHVQAIEDSEVGVADNFENPEKRQTQCAPDSARNFLDQLAAAERRDTNFDRSFFFAAFHCHQQ
jgi:hypothetical protein